MDLYNNLQQFIKKYNQIQEEIKKNRSYTRILDVYALYIAPHLRKSEIEQEMIRAAKKGKKKCKLLQLHSEIPMTEEEFNDLILFVSKSIQSMFSDNRFRVESNKKFVLYILFD